MEKQEFLELAKKHIKGSIHEGYLYTEIQNAYNIIEQYNKSIHTLNTNVIPTFNDDRHIEIRDTHDLLHGAFFFDKNCLYFSLDIDNYELRISIENICQYYKKNIEFTDYTEIFDDEKAILRTIPDQYKYIDKDKNCFIISRIVNVNQVFGHSDNTIDASITEYDQQKQEFVTTNFEYNTLGTGKQAMSIDKSNDKCITRFVTSMIQTPNNNVYCTDNKAYGHYIMFGIENFINKLNNHNFDALNCNDVACYRNKRIEKSSKKEPFEQPSLID